jgi:predicted PurR-regulated permease PerM
VARLSAELPNYAAGAQALQANVVNTLRQLGVDPAQAGQVLSSFGLGAVRDALNVFLASLSSVLSTLVLLGIVLLFLTLDASGAGARLASIAVERPQVAAAMGSFAHGTRRYLVVTTIFGLIVATVDTIGLALIGVPLAFLWGVLTFVTNYIPNIGFFLALIPPAILGLLVGGWPMLLGVVALFTAVGFVFQTVIQPRVMGDAVGLSATVTFVALAFWAWLIGPLGALLAVPLTLLVKVFLVDIDPKASWADAWLRSQSEVEKAALEKAAVEAPAARGP